MNKILPGDRAKVTGIIRLKPPQKGGLVYGRYLEAIHLDETAKEFEEVEISKFGKPKESLKEGKRLHCLDIRTSEYNGVPQYLVDKIEIR